MIKKRKGIAYPTEKEKEKFYAAIDAIRHGRAPKLQRRAPWPGAERETHLVVWS